jgi:hypothetical protein
MLRRALLFAVSVLLIGTSAQAAETESHSGLLTMIDSARQTLTPSEMGPWTGLDTRPIMRSIPLTPATQVHLVRRSQEAMGGGWPGGYVESRLKVTEVHPGDFATVRVARHGRKLSAVSIDVVRPSTDLADDASR